MKNLTMPALFVVLFILTGCVGYIDHTKKMINVNQKAKSDLSDVVVVNDVKIITQQLIMYFADKGEYPENLNKLFEYSNDTIHIKDPQGKDYQYKKISADDYELCFILIKDSGQYKEGNNCEKSKK